MLNWPLHLHPSRTTHRPRPLCPQLPQPHPLGCSASAPRCSAELEASSPLRGVKPNLPKRSGLSVCPTFCFEFGRQWLARSRAGLIRRGAESREPKMDFLLVPRHSTDYGNIWDYPRTRECCSAERNGIVTLYIRHITYEPWAREDSRMEWWSSLVPHLLQPAFQLDIVTET